MQFIRQSLQRLALGRLQRTAVKGTHGAPHLSAIGALIVTCVVAALCAAVAGWQVYALLKFQQDTETKALQERFELVFSSVGEDLKRLAQSAKNDCTPATSQELARYSLRSEFARGFFSELDSKAALCGPLGQTALLTETHDSARSPDDTQRQGFSPIIDPNLPSFKIQGQQSLRPSVLMNYSNPAGVSVWAEIPAGGLLSDTVASRMSVRDQRSTWSLKNLQGQNILRQGTKILNPSSALHYKDWVSDRYGFRLENYISTEQFKARLQERTLAWTLVSLALSLTLIKAINLHFSARMSPERKMKTALRKRQIEPVIQPIVSLESGECLGGEVLMRWKHPVRGLIPPAEFIGLAEENGMIIPMSEMLMRKARDQLADLQNTAMYFSFNVTAAQLRDPSFPQKILDIFDGAGLPPKNVVLELTEREAIGEQDGEILSRLRELGFRIAIDDFGTGQSSLSMLQGLQIDRIKIDREFVRTIDESTERRPVLDTIIVLAKELAVPVIAEGIETWAQWDYLAQRKVEAAQGYLIAKPMPISEFIIWHSQRDLKPIQRPLRVEGRLGSKDRRVDKRHNSNQEEALAT
jgi:sensor c-di-GMP phosphodiesterase-like protein